MKWSWKLGRFAGIDVYVHTTFFLLIGFIGLSSWLQERTIAAVISGIAFILALFLFVVLHEYGHALTARRFGIPTRDITLLPIGGVARLERMPEDPRQELWVALAGPAVNVAIAGILFTWLIATGGIDSLTALGVTSGSIVARLMVVNATLVVFNLLPAFPMDGGRVLRALLAIRMDYTRATRIAANIGKVMAVLFGIVGFFQNPFLVFIAFFVWTGGEQEARMVRMKRSLDGIPVSRAIVTDFHTLEAGNRISEAVDLMMQSGQQDIPVLDRGQVVGILSRDDLMRALTQGLNNVPVSQVMRPNNQSIDYFDQLENAFTRLQACGCRVLPVTYREQLIGLLTLENVGKVLALQTALHPTRARL
jgi:Zn-dependent protease/CBS domain-containing protein